MDNILLENENLRLVFDSENGVLKIMTAVKTGWEIIKRPELGLSFRFLVPLPNRRNNSVFGEKNKFSDYKYDEQEKKVVFSWDSVVSEYGGKHAIKVKLTVSLHDQQALFAMQIENNSEYIVENVYCPYFGEVQHPEDEEVFKTFIYNYGSAEEWPIWPTYKNLRGYYGVDYPTQLSQATASCGTPMSPFCLLRGEKQGLYIGADKNSPELVTWFSELRPGYENSIDAQVPAESLISGLDVAVRFAAVHIPFIKSGESRELTPIAVQAYEGGWQNGVDIYKSWRNNWIKSPCIPNWVKEPHSWQQIHINSPEGELRMRFTELVKIGEACAKRGVKAVQLVGWNDGGQDQGNPSHDPDPRLGTFEELKQAIKDIKAMGIKVILFAKFTWADRATKWFRNELNKYAIKDPYGDYYVHPGYMYQTVTQLLDINTKRLIPMCFLSEKYLEICRAEFKKIVDLGADGFLFDECLHHSPALLCFDESHGHRYGAPVYANDCKLIDEFNKMLPQVNDFLFSGEACYDWEFEAYHLSYFRSENKEHIPLVRYINPYVPLMTAVTGFNDRSMINQCLMYRYIISYEPYNFKGRLDDYPLTVAYGTKMDDLRSELRDYLWDGEFRDVCGASVTTSDGKKHRPYSVFENQTNGKKCIVVCNYDYKETVEVSVKPDDEAKVSLYRLVDEDVWHEISGFIKIPPCSAAVVL